MVRARRDRHSKIMSWRLSFRFDEGGMLDKVIPASAAVGIFVFIIGGWLCIGKIGAALVISGLTITKFCESLLINEAHIV